MSRKEMVMRTVLFAVTLNSEKYEALIKNREQGLDFMYPYKVRKGKILCNII